MKKQMVTSRCVIFTVGITISLSLIFSLLVVSLILPAYQSHKERSERKRMWNEITQVVRSRVKIGDDREKALQAMVDAGAWATVKCGELEYEVIDDYYFFGPKDRKNVIAWMTISIYKDRRYVIDFIGNNRDSIDVPEHCLPHELK